MKGKCKKKKFIFTVQGKCKKIKFIFTVHLYVQKGAPRILQSCQVNSICSCNFLFLSISICSFVFLRTFYECLSLALREFFLAWRLEDDLACVKEKLSAINAVMLDADKKRSKNHRIQLQLGKLKEVFLYNAEEVLDEFECAALRRQVVKTAGR